MDEKQKRKREKRLAKREAQRKQTLRENRLRKAKEAAVGLGILLVLAGGVYWLGRSGGQDIETIATEGESVPSEGTGHVSGEVTYATNPPTSGAHHATAAECRVYSPDDTPADEAIVHSLEHGAIWLSYQPDAPEEVVAALEELGDLPKVLVSARSENDVLVAAAAWTKLLKLESWDMDSQAKLKGFIDANRNNAPENVPC